MAKKNEIVIEQGGQETKVGSASAQAQVDAQVDAATQLPKDAPFIFTAGQFMEMMKEMVKELRHDPDKEAKEAEERRRMEAKRAQRVRLARIEIEKRERMQANCNHRKGPNPGDEPCLGGQTFSDGVERRICLRCQKVVVEIQAPELTAATSLIKSRMIKKAEELGIDAEVMEELFGGSNTRRGTGNGSGGASHLVPTTDFEDE